MKKYNEIALSDEEKKILEWFKGQWFTHVGRTTQYGFVEVIDENNDIRCNLKPMRKPFEFIEKGERYEIEKLLNPPHEPKTVLDLEDGDAYWAINYIGEVIKNYWNSFRFDIESRSQGNVFLTKEEAEFEAKRREVYTKIKKHARPFNHGGENWTPYWSRNRESIGWNCSGYIQEAQLYFENEEQANQAIWLGFFKPNRWSFVRDNSDNHRRCKEYTFMNLAKEYRGDGR